MEERPLEHSDNEDALNTIDAFIFSGCPEGWELNRLEEFCQRWLRGIKEHRDCQQLK